MPDYCYYYFCNISFTFTWADLRFYYLNTLRLLILYLKLAIREKSENVLKLQVGPKYQIHC